MAQVLKPGGRLAVSDIALKRPLPPEVSADVMAYVGCIAGAISLEEYRQGLIDAGFSDVVIVDSGADLNAYAKLENQSGSCSSATNEPSQTKAQNLPIANTGSGCGSGSRPVDAGC